MPSDFRRRASSAESTVQMLSLTLQRYLRAKALLEARDTNAKASEAAESPFAVGFGSTASGGLPVGYFGDDFAQSSSAFGAGLRGVKLRFYGGLCLTDCPPAVFPPAAV